MIMMKEELKELLEVLIGEIDRDLNRPGYYILYKEMFEQLSWEKWASKELMKEVDQSTKGLYATVEDFCHRMNEFSMRDKKTSKIFSAAYDAAMNVLDVVIYDEERRRLK